MKILYIIAAAFILFLPLVTNAATSKIDQQNTVWENCTQVISSEAFGQSFTPTVNKVTKIEVLLRPYDEDFGDINLTLKDDSGSTIAQVTEKPVSGSSYFTWVAFDLPKPVTVSPGTLYAFYINGLNELDTRWQCSNQDAYTKGTLKYGDSTVNSNDFEFKVWGYTDSSISPPSTPKNTPTPIPSRPSPSGAPALSPTPLNTSPSPKISQVPLPTSSTSPLNSSPTPTPINGYTVKPGTVPPVPASKILLPEDKNVPTPKTESITINGKEVAKPAEGQVPVIKVAAEDILVIKGTALANSKVAIIIDNNAYIGTADASGHFEVSIDTNTIKPGKHKVYAQTQTADGKGSVMVLLFEIDKAGYRPPLMLLLGALVLILLVVVGLVENKVKLLEAIRLKLASMPPRAPKPPKSDSLRDPNE